MEENIGGAGAAAPRQQSNQNIDSGELPE